MPMNMWLVVALLFSPCLFGGGSCLRLTDLKVPKHADLGSSVTLECLFDLGKAKLYSVKWYKDDFEFFRYMPTDEKEIAIFKVPGVALDEHLSGKNRVTLTDVVYRSSGTYKCEVSTEAPNFNTSLQSKNMTVLAFPDRPPMITGVQESYTMTEYILANCTSGRSNPGPRLKWYIDGKEPDSWYVIESGLMEFDGPLYARQISLQFPASKISQKRIHINCSATVADMDSVTSTIFTSVSSASANQQLSLERLHNSDSEVVRSCQGASGLGMRTSQDVSPKTMRKDAASQHLLELISRGCRKVRQCLEYQKGELRRSAVCSPAWSLMCQGSARIWSRQLTHLRRPA